MSNTSKIAIAYPVIILGSLISIFTFAPGPEFLFITYFLLYLLISIHVGLVAKNKGRNPVTFALLTFFLTPLITGLVLAVMKNEGLNKSIATKKCPHCAEEIKAEAIKCKECGSSV